MKKIATAILALTMLGGCAATQDKQITKVKDTDLCYSEKMYVSDTSISIFRTEEYCLLPIEDFVLDFDNKFVLINGVIRKEWNDIVESTEVKVSENENGDKFIQSVDQVVQTETYIRQTGKMFSNLNGKCYNMTIVNGNIKKQLETRC